MRREEGRAAPSSERARERQAAAPSQDEAEESDATEEEATRERTTRVGRPRGGMKVAARIGERLRSPKRDRKRRTPKGGRRLAHHTPLLKIPVCVVAACAVPSSHPSLGLSVFFLSFFFHTCASASARQSRAQWRAREFCKILLPNAPGRQRCVVGGGRSRTVQLGQRLVLAWRRLAHLVLAWAMAGSSAARP